MHVHRRYEQLVLIKLHYLHFSDEFQFFFILNTIWNLFYAVLINEVEFNPIFTLKANQYAFDRH